MKPSAPAPWSLVEERRRMMGTTISLHLAVTPAEIATAQRAITACLQWLEEVAARLTRFDPLSELCQLNRAAGTWFAASALLFDCLAAALQAAVATDGLFDPALLPHLEAAGYALDFAQIAHRDVGDGDVAARATGQWRDITLDAPQRRVFLPVGVQIDLGGIAKGWAADQALDQFFAPFAHVLVDIGGDMRLRGGPLPGGFWAIGVDNPRLPDEDNDDHLAVMTLGSGAVATSGATRRWWRQQGHIRHHIIDPRTGQPAAIWTPALAGDTGAARLLASATALAPTAVQAEVAAKVALLRGLPLALTAIAANASEPDAGRLAHILVTGSGEVVCSPNITAYLQHSKVGSNLWLI